MNEFDRLHALSKRLRETYKPGVRIELIHMCSDPQPIPDGSRGTVVAVDDIGSIMMKWDNGRSLSLIYGEDSFRILSPDEVNAERYEKKNHEFIRKLNKDIFPQACQRINTFSQLPIRLGTNRSSVRDWSCILLTISWEKGNGRNLVYFKWTVPADSAGVTFYCKGTINYENAEKEQDSANNSIEYAVISQRKTVSQTPDTRYVKNPPAGYVSNVTPPTTNAGSATWNMWEYENDKLVLKSYGITVGNANPTITPGSG